MNKIIKGVIFEGFGAHTGEFCRIKVYDYPEWVVFERKGELVELSLDKVETKWATIFSYRNFKVFTIEHLLSAFYALSLRGMRVEVEKGSEIPIMDGSALDFAEKLHGSMTRWEGKERFLKIKAPIEIREGDAYIKAFPSDSFEIDYTIEFDHPLIGRQRFFFEFDEKKFLEELAPARTFVMLSQIEALRRMGLAQMRTHEGVIVLTHDGLYDGIVLRYKDEFVRHKVLDLIGDLAFLRYKPLVRIEAYKAGHKLHIALVREILKRAELV